LTPPPDLLSWDRGPGEEVGIVLVEVSVVEQRYDAVKEVLADGLSVTEVAERYGVARQTVHRWIARYQRGGLGALADRSHRPASCPHQMPVVIEARILELRRVHAEWGPARIRYALAREQVQPVPGRSSIYRALVRAGVIQARRRRKRKADYRRWERPAPMELWQLDVMGRVFLADQTELKVVTGIDDHSRFCVLAQLVPRATARRVCAAFSEALRRYGVPEEVLTDNGKVFTARFGPRGAETLFDRICRENGITHRLTAVRSPTTTGKVERFHKTLRDEFFSKHTFTTIEQAQQGLDSFVEDYNAFRPHQSLGERTPAERFRLRVVEAAEPVVPDPVETSEDAVAPAPPNDLRPDGHLRKVDGNGRIIFAGTRYRVARFLAGELVAVRIDGDIVRIFHGDALVKAHPRRHPVEKEEVIWSHHRR
jgi:transposase InsO family protein